MILTNGIRKNVIQIATINKAAKIKTNMTKALLAASRKESGTYINVCINENNTDNINDAFIADSIPTLNLSANIIN